MMRYRRLQHWAMAIGFALVITNGVVGYLTGLSVVNIIFGGLGLVIILLRGDLAGRGR